MKRPAIFFDRDNTLIVSEGYLGDADKVELVTGAADAVARARHLGFAVVVCSNQSGVARGLFSEDAVHAVNARIDDLLREGTASAVIDRHEFCPYHPEASIEAYRRDSELRKPKPGMILAAAQKLALDLSRSWVVGDAPRDIEAGKAAGCRTILVQDPNLNPSPAAGADSAVRPDHTVSSLPEAMEVIERDSLAGPADEAGAEEGAGAEEPQEQVVEEGSENRAAAPEVVTEPVAASEVPPAAPARPAEGASASIPTALLEAVAPATPPPQQTPPPQVRLDEVEAELGALRDVAEQILHEFRRRNEQLPQDFSVSKLLAGIVQVLVLAVLVVSYMYWQSPGTVQSLLLLALTLQALTIALLIMGKQT